VGAKEDDQPSRKQKIPVRVADQRHAGEAERFMSKTEVDFQASLEILNTNIQLFNSGTKSAYRVVAMELRKLLCDGPNTLITRVFQDFGLHKLFGTDLREKMPSLQDGQLLLPGQLTCTTEGKVSFELLFAKPPTIMALDDWLKQPLLGSDITVREMIRSVADKEGAHADKDYNDTLAYAKAVKYMQDDSHMHLIVGIGSYLRAYLRDVIKANSR
jgi:hypothetical protein